MALAKDEIQSTKQSLADNVVGQYCSALLYSTALCVHYLSGIILVRVFLRVSRGVRSRRMRLKLEGRRVANVASHGAHATHHPFRGLPRR